MDDMIFALVIIAIAVLILWAIIWLICVPGNVAARRGVSGGELVVIKILAWCGLLVPITWFVALGLALFWHPAKWISKGDCEYRETDLDKLEKLHKLYKNKVLSKAEYERLKKQAMSKL